MSTLSVPLTKNLEAFIDDAVRRGIGSNKAEVVRKALTRFAEDQAVDMVMQSMREYKEGKILKGDLDTLLNSMP